MFYRTIQNLKVLPKRPRFLLRILYNYLKIMTDRPVLRKGQIGLIYACNCDCPHCSAAQLLTPSKQVLTTEEIKRLIDDFIELGAISIMLTGGEPTLRSDLEEIIDYINPNRAISCLLTNGRDLTFDQLFRYRKAGLGQMAISIDSPDPEEHDRNRGAPGLFSHALDLLRYADSIGIYSQASTIITRDNLHNGQVLRLVKLTAELGLDLNVLFASPVGRWTGETEQLLSGRDWDRIRKEILFHPHVRWEGYSSYLKKCCGAGREKIHVTAYGDVIPCDFIQISFGNIRDEPLKSIWQRMLKVEPFQKLQPVCICSLDRKFMNKYLLPLGEFDSKPVAWEKLKGRLGRPPLNSPAPDS